MKTKVIQVPMDEKLLEALDSLSKEEGRSRAALIREACRRYLQGLEDERLDQIYIEGYARIPEEPAIGEAQAALSARILPKEEW